jgi:transcriptional regulator GlxA family with amidase domain
LAQILFVQALRSYSEGDASMGWLGALSDPRIGDALRLMHGAVDRAWTVAELAAAVGMSRSSFAERFKARVGIGAFEYLLRWRMQLATQALRSRETSISTLSASLGYASESAFSNAFKRTMGTSPRRYWSSVEQA